jgi:hypothetical protein
MPFKSKAQAHWMFANQKALKKQGVNVNEWASQTNWKKLPNKAPKKAMKRGRG